jgi:hypothetical protein
LLLAEGYAKAGDFEQGFGRCRGGGSHALRIACSV